MKQPKELRLSIRYENHYGYVGYSQGNQNIFVQLDDAGKRGEIEKYLGQEQNIPICTENAQAFIHKKILASTGVSEFKAVLTCLWNATGVSVDWSRPVEI